jgi:hypothetical protein
MQNNDTGAFSTNELDWTHINETILMIGLAVAQIEKTLTDGDESISVLTGSFISMMVSIESISKDVEQLQDKTVSEENAAKSIELLDTLDSNASDADSIHLSELRALVETMNFNLCNNPKEKIADSTQKASVLIQETIVAFQFYDRLSQRLHQIVNSLGMMSQLFADKQRLHNPYEWAELQDSIKSRYTIDADRIMFDALLAGATIEEAVGIATDYEDDNETVDTEIELF